MTSGSIGLDEFLAKANPRPHPSGFSRCTAAGCLAEEWLNHAPQRPEHTVRCRAQCGYDAPHAPDSAIGWALTLLQGGDRDQTLKKLQEAWLEEK